MTTTTKAPLEGDIVLDSLKPPHGKITGFVDLPAPGTVLTSLGEVRAATGGYPLTAQEFAVVTYQRVSLRYAPDVEYQTIHLGPGDVVAETFNDNAPIQAFTWTKKSGYIIKLK